MNERGSTVEKTNDNVSESQELIIEMVKNINDPKRLKFYYKLISGMEKEEVV